MGHCIKKKKRKAVENVKQLAVNKTNRKDKCYTVMAKMNSGNREEPKNKPNLREAVFHYF